MDIKLGRVLTLLFSLEIKPCQAFLLDCFTIFIEIGGSNRSNFSVMFHICYTISKFS